MNERLVIKIWLENSEAKPDVSRIDGRGVGLAHKHIEIQIGESGLTLPLGTSVDNISSILASKRFDRTDDPEVNATYFELLDDGLDIVAKDSALSTVFLHLTPQENRKNVFKGSTNFLSRKFFEAPSAEQFEQSLSLQGFVRSLRQFPYAIDMLTSEVRLRYEDRRGQRMICFDDGARIRGR